jgi:hypothetical protein
MIPNREELFSSSKNAKTALLYRPLLRFGIDSSLAIAARPALRAGNGEAIPSLNSGQYNAVKRSFALSIPSHKFVIGLTMATLRHAR